MSQLATLFLVVGLCDLLAAWLLRKPADLLDKLVDITPAPATAWDADPFDYKDKARRALRFRVVLIVCTNTGASFVVLGLMMLLGVGA
jgi:hypothetical protein